jgi:hypothetical protein
MGEAFARFAFHCRSARVHALQLMRDLPQAFVANRRLKLTRRRREGIEPAGRQKRE